MNKKGLIQNGDRPYHCPRHVIFWVRVVDEGKWDRIHCRQSGYNPSRIATGVPIEYSNRRISVESIKLDEVLGIMNAGKPLGLGDS